MPETREDLRVGNIKIKVLEVIPLNINVQPRLKLLSYQIIDGDKRLPPIRVLINDRTNIRDVLKRAIETYIEVKDFLSV